jgi:hypothetical protein
MLWNTRSKKTGGKAEQEAACDEVGSLAISKPLPESSAISRDVVA